MQKIEQYISDLEKLPEPKKTILEILKVHRKEVSIANLLAYFFRNNEEHGLNNLFIKALLLTKFTELKKHVANELINLETFFELSNLDNKDFKKLIVKTEEPTYYNNRIDIFLRVPEKFVVCIEFKINHDLDNPLGDYEDYIKKEYKNEKKIFLILTPYSKPATGKAKTHISENDSFKQVTLRDFVKNIEVLRPENNNNIYLSEFIQTIKNREILSKRWYLLNELLKDLNEYTFYNNNKFTFHNNHKGGFIELKDNNNRIKIRIKNKHWKIEVWKNNKIERSQLLGLKHTNNLLIDIIGISYGEIKPYIIKDIESFHTKILNSQSTIQINSIVKGTNRVDNILKKISEKISYTKHDLSKTKTIYLKINTDYKDISLNEIGQITDWFEDYFTSKCDVSLDVSHQANENEFEIKLILTHYKYHFLDINHEKIFVS